MSIFGDIKKGKIPGTKHKIPGKQAVDFPKQVAREVKKQLEETLQSVLKEFFKLFFYPLHKKAINVLKVGSPDTVWLSVGIVTLTITQVPSKIGKIEYWLQHPPLNQQRLKRMIEELAPADVEIALKGNIPGLSVGAGATLVYLPHEFINRLPKIWNEIKGFM